MLSWLGLVNPNKRGLKCYTEYDIDCVMYCLDLENAISFYY